MAPQVNVSMSYIQLSMTQKKNLHGFSAKDMPLDYSPMPKLECPFQIPSWILRRITSISSGKIIMTQVKSFMDYLEKIIPILHFPWAIHP